MLKDFKYWAGLFDSDGSFDIHPTKRKNGNYYLNVRASLYQKDRTVLDEFASYYDAKVVPSKGCYAVTLYGTNANKFMTEIKKHLVVKYGVVDHILKLRKTTTDNMPATRASVKASRSIGQAKVFPSRKWMAGYVDGDGCIHSSYRKKDGVLEFKLAVVSHVTQMCGLELMKKQFGGRIYSQGDVRKWSVSLSISKGKQVLGYFSKHLKMKRSQADLVLECLNSKKHLRREGATKEGNLLIHKRLQELKSTATTKRVYPFEEGKL